MRNSKNKSTSMRIHSAKLNYFNENCPKQLSYDDLMGRIIKYIEERPNFKREVFSTGTDVKGWLQ